MKKLIALFLCLTSSLAYCDFADKVKVVDKSSGETASVIASGVKGLVGVAIFDNSGNQITTFTSSSVTATISSMPGISTAGPALQSVTDLTLADTEYSVAVPASIKEISFQARQAVAIRFAFTTGKVATPTDPYFTVKASTSFEKLSLNTTSTVTVYFAASDAGTDVELIGW